MLERLPVRRHVRRLATLTLAVLALAAVPGRYAPAAAQETLVDEDLVDQQGQFAQGTLQRTAVSAGTVPLQNGNAPFGDKDGVLQLAPIGGLDPANWSTTIPLPQPRAQMGVTTIGNRLFVIGGAGGVSQAGAFANSAYWAKLDPQTGAVIPHALTSAPPGADIATSQYWVNDPMPAVSAWKLDDPYPECNSENIQQRAAPAVASFTAGNGKSYIYVIGGAFLMTGCGNVNISSSAVQIGEFDPATNDIVWTTGTAQRANYVPSQDLPGFESWATEQQTVNPALPSFGVEQATASVVTTSSGATYLYVIGGLINYFDPDTASMATPAVFYTRLNATTGAFENPIGAADTIWARTNNVPMNELQDNPLSAPNPGFLGIYNHVSIVSRAIVGSGTTTTVTPVIYVTGGYTTNEVGLKTANAAVFRAKIGAQGALTWDTSLYTPAPSEKILTEGKGRAGAGGIAFANKLYVFGGVADNNTGGTGGAGATAPYGTATVAVHNDRLDILPLFGDVGSRVYFFGTDVQPDLFTPVHGIGAAMIPAAPLENATTVDNAAFGYVVGGFNSTAQTVATVYRAKLGGSGEATSATARRIPDGWYYSKFFNIRLSQGTSSESDARIVAITWYTGINRTNPNADLKVEFRRTRQLPCNEAAFTGTGTEWKSLDGDTATRFFSKGGDAVNEVKLADVPTLADPIASCMQFRVYMTQNGTTNDGVPIAAANPGLSPQLYRLSIQKIKPGDPDLFIDTFTISTNPSGQISGFNLRVKNLNGTLLNTSAVAGGQFPVVLCVDRRDLTASPNFTFTPPTLPIVNDPDSRVNCAPLYRWMDPSETIPGQVFALNNNWRVNFNNYYPGKTQDSAMNPVTAAFTRPGHYAVTAMIDPFGVVAEGGAKKANNRGENLNNGQPLVRRFTITNSGSTLYLPVVRR